MLPGVSQEFPTPLRLLAASARLRRDRPAPLVDGLQASRAVRIQKPTGLRERLDLDSHRRAPLRNAGETIGLEAHVAMPVRGEKMHSNRSGIRGEIRRVPIDKVDRRRAGVPWQVRRRRGPGS